MGQEEVSLCWATKKNIPVRQRAGNIMSQNFPSALERYLYSLAISNITMKSDFLISWFATFSICTIFNISAKMRRVANLYVYLNLRRWFPLKLLLRSFFSTVLSNKVWSLLIYSKGINNRRQNGKVNALSFQEPLVTCLIYSVSSRLIIGSQALEKPHRAT